MQVGDLVRLEECVRATGRTVVARVPVEAVVIKVDAAGLDVVVPSPFGIVRVALGPDGWERPPAESAPSRVAWRITAHLGPAPSGHR